MNTLTNSALMAMVAFAGPALALISTPPGDGPLLVIAPPSISATELVRQANGWAIGPDVTSLTVLAWSNAPNFSDSLHEAGALLVRDGRILADICGVSLK